MDHPTVAFNSFTEDANLADRTRLDAFRLGTSMPSSSINTNVQRPSHGRSHSRTTSHSLPMSSSINSSVSAPSVVMADSPPSSPSRLSSSGSKRSSHHRRRSSVSTRRESAEIMGVNLSNIVMSSSEDNINLGDKDSIRRRALWTLEGKTDVGSFSKVEIPELGTPEVEKKSFDFPSKPSYPPGIGVGFSGSLNSLIGNKRDSFGKFMPPSSSKEHLHTLMEEEEEEEESGQDVTITSSPVEEVATSLAQIALASLPTPSRHRPATLNLRPLSLTPSSAVFVDDGSLPTPSPSPNVRPGLRALTLTPVLDTIAKDNDSDNSQGRKRQSLILLDAQAPSTIPLSRHPSLYIPADIPTPVPAVAKMARRSSIAYHCSSDTPQYFNYGLPTPEMTPVSERRYSNCSTDSDISRGSSRGSRPLSVSEQHFLFQAHQTLVQRISDLERVLSTRPRSRPQSYASDVSAQSEPPSDEMLQLIADLKAERDELKKDVDGWRTRLGDSQKQMSILLKRVEVERREAWVARERAGLMEVEKRSMEKSLVEKISWGEDGWNNYREAKDELAQVHKECELLRTESQRVTELEVDCLRLKAELSEEKRKREELERELEGVLATPTPRAFEFKNNFGKPMPGIPSRSAKYVKRGGLGFRSIDSVGSFTDVESVDGSPDQHPFSLKAVEEEEENDGQDDSFTDCSDEENGLAGYEDEEDNDEYIFHESSSTSSLGSVDDFPRSTSHLLNTPDEAMPTLTSSRSSTSSPTSFPPSPAPAHTRNASLSNWTFPHPPGHPSDLGREPDEIDRFFGCLEDVDNSPPLNNRMISIESGKNLFSQALANDDDELPPFVLPPDVGVEVVSPDLECAPRAKLDVVLEEEEEKEDSINPDDEFVGEEVEGGIIFTFSPPPPFDESKDADTVNSLEVLQASPVVDPPHDIVEEFTSQSRPHTTSPSSIPRRKTFISFIPPPSSSTPVKSKSVRSSNATYSPSAFSTPPAKRNASPTFIPQPKGGSASPLTSTPVKDKLPSFIPQPRRTSASPSPVISKTLVSPSTSTPISQTKRTMSMHDDPFTSEPPSASPQMKTQKITCTDIPQANTVSSLTSPTLVARYSFQKLTNFIPMPALSSWSPRSRKIGTSSTAASALRIIPSGSYTSTFINDDHTFDPSTNSTADTPCRERGYVAKEKQLEKLRIRLAQEARMKAQGRVVISAYRNLQDSLIHI